ncbi:MAG: manganese efflux pump MntP family protein [Synergistaceae bacterium]|nr:manganese efflux pump MntP family protein [Synergistaceae bacterium]
MLESVLSAVSLSMDAFAAALCVGACTLEATRGTALRMGMACGIFQFFMPLGGWFLVVWCTGSMASVEHFDHWVAFVLLAFVGGNMIRGAFAPPEKCDTSDPTRSVTLLILALATSIDALVVGAGLSLVRKPVLFLAVCAGCITAVLCFAGVKVGRSVGTASGKRMEFVGGVLLVLIGFNILRTHLWS